MPEFISKETTYEICYVCGSVGKLIYKNVVDKLYHVLGQWNLLECPKCKLVWPTPKPKLEELQNFYTNYHTHTESKIPGQLSTIISEVLPVIELGYSESTISTQAHRFGKLLRLIGPIREIGLRSVMWLPAINNGKLLDIGCGSGNFLQYMQKMGWEVSGIEFDPKAAEIARSNIPSSNIFIGDIEDLVDKEIQPNCYDAISMIHVIEHLLDPIKTIHTCFRLLKPGGRLVIITPNASSLGRKKFGRHWRGWEPPRHIHIFNVYNLKKISEKAGFHLTNSRSTSSGALIISMLSFFLREKKADLATESRTPATPTRLTKARCIMFWLYEYLLTISGKQCGEEVVLIAEKPETI